MIAGVVLAGGRSTRLGSEKAMARVGPTPLVGHAVEVLANGCGAVAVNAPPGGGAARWARAHGLEVLPDREEVARGPLAGVLAALDWGASLGVELVAVAPCDCPALPRDLVARLVAGLTPEAGAATAVSPEGLEPACAVWRVSARRRVEAALADGAHPALRKVLVDLGASEVRFDDARAFADADTLAQLKALGGRTAWAAGVRSAAAAAARAAAAALLAAYAFGGVVLAALAAGAGTAAVPSRGIGRLADLRFDGLAAVVLTWLALVVWAGPRLVARPPSPRRPLAAADGVRLTRPPDRRI